MAGRPVRRGGRIQTTLGHEAGMRLEGGRGVPLVYTTEGAEIEKVSPPDILTSALEQCAPVTVAHPLSAQDDQFEIVRHLLATAPVRVAEQIINEQPRSGASHAVESFAAGYMIGVKGGPEVADLFRSPHLSGC